MDVSSLNHFWTFLYIFKNRLLSSNIMKYKNDIVYCKLMNFPHFTIFPLIMEGTHAGNLWTFLAPIRSNNFQFSFSREKGWKDAVELYHYNAFFEFIRSIVLDATMLNHRKYLQSMRYVCFCVSIRTCIDIKNDS